MKTIVKTYQVFEFSELSEDAKQKALENNYDVNVDSDWWDCTYEDAENICLKITGFDIDRGNYCKCNFTESAEETANLIIENHGQNCETYKDAEKYLENRAELVKKYSDGINTDIVAEDNEYDFDNDCDELDSEFLKTISEDYLSMLRKEYEYLTSEESIIETIEANDWTFLADGTMKNS